MYVKKKTTYVFKNLSSSYIAVALIFINQKVGHDIQQIFLYRENEIEHLEFRQNGKKLSYQKILDLIYS